MAVADGGGEVPCFVGEALRGVDVGVEDEGGLMNDEGIAHSLHLIGCGLMGVRVRGPAVGQPRGIGCHPSM